MRERREEEEISRAPAATPGTPQYGPGPGRRQVELEGGISALIPGRQAVHAIWLTGDKVIKTGDWSYEIEVGSEFDIHVRYTSENAGLIQAWRSCVTVKDTKGLGIENYEDTLVYLANQGQFASEKGVEVVLNNLGKNIMPNADFSLRVKVWMNDDSTPDPPYPPRTQW